MSLRLARAGLLVLGFAALQSSYWGRSAAARVMHAAAGHGMAGMSDMNGASPTMPDMVSAATAGLEDMPCDEDAPSFSVCATMLVCVPIVVTAPTELAGRAAAPAARGDWPAPLTPASITNAPELPPPRL